MFDIKWYADRVKIYADNVYVSLCDINTVPSNVDLELFARGGSDYGTNYLKWVAVHQCELPEPTYPLGAKGETLGSPIVDVQKNTQKNNSNYGININIENSSYNLIYHNSIIDNTNQYNGLSSSNTCDNYAGGVITGLIMEAWMMLATVV